MISALSGDSIKIANGDPHGDFSFSVWLCVSTDMTHHIVQLIYVSRSFPKRRIKISFQSHRVL